MRYDKDEIKRNLSIEQVYGLVASLGGSPQMQPSETAFTSQTICHCGKSHKLYYYANSQLFQCFTNCGYFDVFGLIQRVKNIDLVDAMTFVSKYFNLKYESQKFFSEDERLEDWSILEKYHNTNLIQNEEKKVELNKYDASVLQYLPRPHILDWEEEGISNDIIQRANICYNPLNQSIIIPHYDINGTLIGIRERTLIKEEEQYGKYRPAILNGQMYNHPLSFNLYNLNNSKDNIATAGVAIVFEGEKSPLKYASYFGCDNDISVATCGSSLINHQVELLLSVGAKEIVVAYDKQFKEIGDEEFKQWTKKLTDIHTKYSSKCQISFIFDKWGLLDYKDAPIDKDYDTFIKLYQERITL